MATKMFTPVIMSSYYNISKLMFRSTGGLQNTARMKRPALACPTVMRRYSNQSDQSKKSDSSSDVIQKLPGSLEGKFVPFEDEKRIIQDITEAEWDPVEQDFQPQPKIVYERGKTGVFDLPELVQLLREENALDICVIRIPPEMDYADYMIIATSQSKRHLFSLATFVRKRFKNKNLKPTDVIPRLEGGKDNDDWIALDLGNLILHLFTAETRELYALETLWTVGAQFDDLTHTEDSDIVQLLNLFR